MSDLTRASARTRIDVAEAGEIARAAGADDPDLIAREDLEGRLGSSALILDGLRRRPRYFDGRFLTGADLTRDQDYIRQRQADIARAAGTGVVAGLRVRGTSDRRGQAVVIEPGHGITPGGDLVMIERQRTVPLADLPSARRLNASLGLRLEPRTPLGRRTGLFVLALRPVEFSANPIAAYPTTISGPRSIEDGDIIEATAVTLIPYPGGGVGTLEEARRMAAREIFLGEPRGLPQDALPLAMLALDRGALAWVDLGLVRRETGADTPLQVSLGARPRALAEAFVLQHQEHLADVVAARRAAGLPDAFAAAQSFAALPPAGQLPAAAILPGGDGFRQLWFPPRVDVDLAFAPADEIAALVDESLTLPPIDLAAAEDELDATGVVVLAPVSRARLSRFALALERLSIRAFEPPALARARPPALELSALLARRNVPVPAASGGSGALTAAESAELAAWRAAWTEAVAALPPGPAEAPMLWYVRRRIVPQHSAMAGVAVPIGREDEDRVEEDVRDRVERLGLDARVDAVNASATDAASARITRLLASPRLAGSDVLLTAAVRELEAAVPGATRTRAGSLDLTETDIRDRVFIGDRRGDLRLDGAIGRERLDASRALRDLDVARRRSSTKLTEQDVADVESAFAARDLGEGLARIEEARGGELAGDDAVWLGDSGHALALDRLAVSLGEPRVAPLAERLDKIVEDRDAETLAKLVARPTG